MPMCEKCWIDAYKMEWYGDGNQADNYKILLDERKENPCTPEQQAGQDAKICPKCKRKTMHQINDDICMNPKCV